MSMGLWQRNAAKKSTPVMWWKSKGMGKVEVLAED